MATPKPKLYDFIGIPHAPSLSTVNLALIDSRSRNSMQSAPSSLSFCLLMGTTIATSKPIESPCSRFWRGDRRLSRRRRKRIPKGRRGERRAHEKGDGEGSRFKTGGALGPEAALLFPAFRCFVFSRNPKSVRDTTVDVGLGLISTPRGARATTGLRNIARHGLNHSLPFSWMTWTILESDTGASELTSPLEYYRA